MIASTRVLTPVLLLAAIAGMLGTGCDGKPSRSDTIPAESPEGGDAIEIEVVTKAEFDKGVLAGSEPVLVVTKEAFEKEVLKADVPVLVDFYATWCPPCKVLSPRLAKLATEFEGKAKFVKVDVDKSKELAKEYQTRSIPTVIVFNKGKAASPIVGLHDADTYRKAIDAAIEANK